MLRLTALILLFIGGLQGYGQDWKGYYQAEIGGGVTADRLPFWLHTNTFGKITNDTYLWGTVGVGTPFSKSDTRAFDYSFGFEGTGALGRKEHRIFIDQLYGRVRWQNLRYHQTGNCLRRSVFYQRRHAVFDQFPEYARY